MLAVIVSPAAIATLTVIAMALLAGLYVTRRRGDCPRTFSGKSSEPETVMISPSESRKVKTVP